MTTRTPDDPTTIPDIYKEAHQRLPDHVRVLPTSHPAYQDALREMCDVVLADVRDHPRRADRAHAAQR